MAELCIRYTVACDAEIGGLPQGHVTRLAPEIAGELEQYVKRRWPSARREVRVVPENLRERSCHPTVEEDGRMRHDLIEHLRCVELSLWLRRLDAMGKTRGNDSAAKRKRPSGQEAARAYA